MDNFLLFIATLYDVTRDYKCMSPGVMFSCVMIINLIKRVYPATITRASYTTN